MLGPIDTYFLSKREPVRSCLLFTRNFILGLHPQITETWKYGMPFYCYKNKMFSYLWVHRKIGYPYLGIVEGNKINHPDLIRENRSRMKIFLMDPQKKIQVEKLENILKQALQLYT